MKNFKNKKEALEFMIENPGVKGVIFSIMKNNTDRQIELCLKTLHDLREQAKGISYRHGYIELFNNSVIYFRAGGFPESYHHLKFDFTVERIPASVLKFLPDIDDTEKVEKKQK